MEQAKPQVKHVYHAPLQKDISLLGFGAMRLPTQDGAIDLAHTARMIDLAMASGINYYDTAYTYHGSKSEGALQELLVAKYPRHSFFLADKLPSWPLPELQERADMDKVFAVQLQRLGVDYLDFYLVHSVDYNRGWRRMRDKGVRDFLDQQKAAGKIRHAGFSFHGAVEDLAKIIAEYDFDFVQLQLNYYDWQGQLQAAECYRQARQAGLPVMIMEPLRGGHLAKPLGPALAGPSPVQGSFASLALRFLAELEGVATILSGMSNLDQLEDNIATMINPLPLNVAERQLVADLQEYFRGDDYLPCTTCRYCEGVCPEKIEIARSMEAINDYRVFREERLLREYQAMVAEKRQAKQCTACGACQEICPQQIAIPAQLAAFNQYLPQNS